MRFASVCSGIGAPEVAWRPMWGEPVFVSEIEKFPSAVLAHHMPSVPNFGDFTRIANAGPEPDRPVDLLVGGTPCQAFSVAGKRAGLDDPRGNLTLEYLALARRLRPRWLVWENVPGVLSIDEGRTFGTFLGLLGQLGYRWAYRVLDAQYFGVPQRRRRVFVVGCLGDWQLAAAVLFEPESMRGDTPPRREAGQRPAPTISARPSGGGGGGTDFDCDGGLVAGSLQAKDGRGAHSQVQLVAHSLRGEGFDASEDGSGLGTPLVFDTTQITSKGNYSVPKPGDPCHPLAHGQHAPAVAFDARQSDTIQYGEMTGPLDTDGHTHGILSFSCKDHAADASEIAPTLRSMGHDGSHANAGGQVAAAFAIGSHAGAADGDQSNRSHANGGPVGSNVSEELAYSLRGGRTQSVATSTVRRLTPRECERLQGFPDDFTLIPWRSGMAPDGPRYKALGNSMAVPVLKWIGERIDIADKIAHERQAA